MTHFYAITWNLEVRDLGMHESMTEADFYAADSSTGAADNAMYICQQSDLLDLKKNIESILS